MGCAASTQTQTQSDPESEKQHKQVEKQLRRDKSKFEATVKVLLLGSGDSGKSTVLKQMRVIHDNKWTDEEIENFRQQVFNNLTHGMRAVLEAVEYNDLNVLPENEEYLSFINNPVDIRDGQPFPTEYLIPLLKLWQDPHMQRIYTRANDALPENLSYFYSDLERLFTTNYVPTPQDIIRTRTRTTGIQETIFSLRDHELLMVDVGGQKSERRKWIHCFQDVTAILFLVSLSGYDQCLAEDKSANQMQDAMTIWDSICHSQWFKTTSLIIFLNKDDIFKEKIKTSPIRNAFPDYEGKDGDYEAGKEYFKKRFMKLSHKAAKQKEREVYPHFTNATDTEMLRVIMSSVEE